MNTLRQAVQEYLILRRSLGFKLRDAGKLLQAYIKFMEEQRAPYITTKLALAWAQQPSTVQPAEWARRARPYLYSAQEIRCFLRAALSLPARGGLRPWTYHCLFGLLSVTGMRIGEARNLELQDVDLRTGVLTIRSAKFGKSRLIPIHASTRRVLADYLARRDRKWAAHPVSSYVFLSNWGNQLDGGEIRRTFYALSRRIGLRGRSDSHGPRLHDMRHRFAVMALLRWYRSGKDVERKLPYLSAYLGHVHVSDTYWYLSAWPELMREAMSRLERCWEGQS